jgi:hypothetical protein
MSRAKKATAKPPAVHFTHHLCLERVEGLQPYHRACEDERLTGREYPGPRWKACHDSRYRTTCFATKWSRVTCPKCPDAYVRHNKDCRSVRFNLGAGKYEPQYKRIASNEMLTWVAWLACCRHVGVPSPRSPEQTADQLERMAIGDRVDAVRRLVPLSIDAWQYKHDKYTLDEARAKLESQVAALDDELRAALTPAVNDLLVAYDIATEVERLLQHACTQADTVIERLWSRERLVAGPEPEAA